jgi:endonuclease YncB( thermonuclease family)
MTKKLQKITAQSTTEKLTKITPSKKSSTGKIALVGYAKILSDVQMQINQARGKIIENITRQKVVMAWEIGKIINEHLSRNTKTGYGEKLIEQLVQDTSLSDKILYKMRSFYQAYPKLPRDDSHLNWTHYQMLSGVKKEEERQRLENLTRENAWSTDDLQHEVNKSKNIENNSSEEPETKVTIGNGRFAKKDAKGNVIAKTTTVTKLRPERGQLFSYPLISIEETGKTYIDLGFNIFREIEEALPATVQQANAVDVTKTESKQKTGSVAVYSLKKSELRTRKFNTYKAYLERVVDGDTLHFNVDLGFKTLHKEIFRLKGLNAPESNTDEGKKSSRVLNNLLKDVAFVVIKTIKTDIYGRYVADVFLPSDAKENDPQKVANGGVYLNQLLLEKGSVTILEEYLAKRDVG